jgi:DNA-binding MarR family transcriptional regulator
VVQEADSIRFEAALAIVRQATARLNALTDRYSPGDRGSLRAMAERLYAERRRRDEHFPAGLFGEPAWDLLLALFIAHDDGRDLSPEEAFAAAQIEPEDGPPLIERLEAAGLVQRRRAPQDRRRAGLALTDRALNQLGDYLADSV